MIFIHTRTTLSGISRLFLTSLIVILLIPFIVADEMDIHNGAMTRIETTHQEWVTTKQTGQEKGLIFWTADKFDKKAHIGWIVDNSKYLGNTQPKILTDCNHMPIKDDKNKDITLKYETAKCDGVDCWSIALTDAKAVNVPDCITIGEQSMVSVYMNISKVVHEFDGKQINATLLKEVGGEFVHAPDDLFIRETDNIKFGAIDNYPDVEQRYKYMFDSTDYIYRESSNRFYIITGREDVDLMRYKEQREYIDVSDVCLTPYLMNTTSLNGSIIEEIFYNNTCIFNLTNNNESNFLHVTFMCNNYTDGKCYIDPEFQTEEVNLSKGYYNNTLYDASIVTTCSNDISLKTHWRLLGNGTTIGDHSCNSSNDATATVTTTTVPTTTTTLINAKVFRWNVTDLHLNAESGVNESYIEMICLDVYRGLSLCYNITTGNWSKI